MKTLICATILSLFLSACGQQQSTSSSPSAEAHGSAAVLGSKSVDLNDQAAIDQALQGEHVLLKFGAEWCGPCKMIAPELVALAQERSDLTVIDIDVDEHEDLARKYGVQSIPALYLLAKGTVVDQKVGYFPKADLASWVDQTFK